MIVKSSFDRSVVIIESSNGRVHEQILDQVASIKKPCIKYHIFNIASYIIPLNQYEQHLHP